MQRLPEQDRIGLRPPINRTLRYVFGVVLAISLCGPAGALEIRDTAVIFDLVGRLSQASTATEFDNILREAAKRPSPWDTEPIGNAYAVLWFDNSIPRVRVWLYELEAESLFRDVLNDRFLLESVILTGDISADLEFRSDRPAQIDGSLTLHNSLIKWRDGEFLMDGVDGRIPYRQTIGATSTERPAGNDQGIVSIESVRWGGSVLSDDLQAYASYRNRILRFDSIQLNALGGSGLGTLVLDHRGSKWRSAAMIKFKDLQLNQFDKLLPGLPILATRTHALLEGRLALLYTAPNAIDVEGEITSSRPGAIQISPLLYEKVRKHINSPIIPFRSLKLSLVPEVNGEILGVLEIYPKRGDNLVEWSRGFLFQPASISVRFPFIPFVKELRN